MVKRTSSGVVFGSISAFHDATWSTEENKYTMERTQDMTQMMTEATIYSIEDYQMQRRETCLADTPSGKQNQAQSEMHTCACSAEPYLSDEEIDSQYPSDDEPAEKALKDLNSEGSLLDVYVAAALKAHASRQRPITAAQVRAYIMQEHETLQVSVKTVLRTLRTMRYHNCGVEICTSGDRRTELFYYDATARYAV